MDLGAWLLAAVGVALGTCAGFVFALLLLGRRTDARALATFVPDCAVLFSRLVRDPRVAIRHKLILAALAAYLAAPLDLVPDFIPVAGQLDDAVLVVVILRFVLRGSGPASVREHWPGPASSLKLVLALAGRTA